MLLELRPYFDGLPILSWAPYHLKCWCARKSSTVARAEVRYDNEGQFVELPPGLEFPEGVTDVEIVVVGTARWIVPIQRLANDDEPTGSDTGQS